MCDDDQDYPDCPNCKTLGDVEFLGWIYGGRAAEFHCRECGLLFDTASPELDFGLPDH